MSGGVRTRSRTFLRATAVAAGLVALAMPETLAPAAVGRARPPVGQVRVKIAPTAIRAGGVATVSGTLRGGAPGGKPVVLQASVFPFQVFGPQAQGSSDGQARYSFRVSPRVNTRYQVISTTQKPVASQIVALTVGQRVTVQVSDRTPRRGHVVVFSGAVSPANPGATVYIQRRSINSGRFRTISQTLLVAAGPRRSTFSKRVRITRTALYAARVRGTFVNAQGFSPALALHVH